MRDLSLHAMKAQRGSALTMVIVVLFFAMLLTLAIRLGPAYLDNYTISKTIAGVSDTQNIARMSPEDIRGHINRRLAVNNVRGFNTRDIQVERDGDSVRLTLDYEVRTPLFGNVDAVISFNQIHEFRGR
ncbi:MAG: DUF4845 domain-containing protein [Marinobacter sp.]|nr:DUF4845 domain-containing protein [Marinobacter sp.]